MRRLPLFTWMNFINSFLILIALPVLNAGLAMILIDRQLEGHFFLPIPRRFSRSLATHFLGLWPSGSLHRGSSCIRHDFGNHSGFFT